MSEFTTTKFDYFAEVQAQLGLRSVWSIYDVQDMGDQHGLGSDIEIAYVKGTEHWGDVTSTAKVAGDTIAALYVAADKCIRESGDNHHIYIEGFERSSVNPKVFFLHTGS